MTRLLLTILFTLGVVFLYRTININLFSVDLPRKTSNELFKLGSELEMDESVVIMNVGKLHPTEISSKIDMLLSYGPKRIGVNLCHFNSSIKGVAERYAGNDHVVFTNCGQGPNSLSRIINDGNTVTHFKSDNDKYFETNVSNSWNKIKQRGNSQERINYRGTGRHFFQADLSNPDSFFPEIVEDNVVLVGYIGDYITEEIYDYTSCRITPLNPYYGDDTTPDMYDTQISANIIAAINNDDFINDFPLITRVLILLAFSFLNVLLLTFIRTKWIVLNLTIYAIIFLVFMFLTPMIILYLFERNYFLELDELPMILIITTIFTVFSNIWSAKASRH